MEYETRDRKINWYRPPMGRETLAALNQHSDVMGFLQTLGFLGLVILTGAAAWYSIGRLPIPVVILLFFCYCYMY